MFALASRLKMPVQEVETWPMSLIAEWMAFFKIEKGWLENDTDTQDHT